MLSQEILKSPCGSQAVDGVYMYPNTQYKNKNQGQGVSLRLSINATVVHSRFFQLQSISIGSLRYGHYGLRTTSGRENPSHAWTGPTTLKGRENWSVV